MVDLILTPGVLDLPTLRNIYGKQTRVRLEDACFDRIRRSQAVVDDVLAAGDVVYGINTGFGLLARKRIADEDLIELQRKLVLSHACGVGELLPDDQVRLIMVLKIASLAQGYSGVSVKLIETLISLLNAGVYPCIPAKGSVSASGDLAPLAHMSLTFIGAGQVRFNGKVLPTSEGLKAAGVQPIKLRPKEGLALLNGTQACTAMALAALFQTENLLGSALVTGALSVDAALGSDGPFDERIHALRGHPGQRQVAAIYRSLLAGSEIRRSHEQCERVQDPYSLRCQPQVMGACLDNLRHAANVLVVEANSVTDNPLVFASEGEIISGGNFHAEPVAMAADLIAICIAEIGALSERRTALLIDTHLSELPPFLVEDGGLNSGFMMAQVTAAALASENKSLAHPACVDSLPTSANQEDHVSMAAFAARRLLAMIDNSACVVAVELLAACQGIDLRAPLKSSKALQQAHAAIRARVPYYAEDRYFAPDIEAAKALVLSGDIGHGIPSDGLL